VFLLLGDHLALPFSRVSSDTTRPPASITPIG
jgi:hypothetical protein